MKNDREWMPEPHAVRRSLPRSVWALGVVSLLMDTSSELIHSLLPLFMVSTLGATVLTVGLVEGVAEATASIAKLGSGALSDRYRTRKPLVLGGYALAAASKVLFPLASSISWVLTARFIDRLGKGLRGAPRDALLADVTPLELRGAAYGLRQALDSIGAVLGPLFAVVLMAAMGDARTVLWVPIVPAALAVATLAVGVREPPTSDRTSRPPRLDASGFLRLPPHYWAIVSVAAVFTLARFSEAFLLLRGQSVGFGPGQAPLIMVVMNIVFAAAAYPAGRAADRRRAVHLLGAGLGTLIAADLILTRAASQTAVLAGAACWGLHMALTQGLWAKLVADAAPVDMRGTAFGVFNLVTGIALLVASALAGWLWTAFGPSATFLAGAVFASLALGGVGVWSRRTAHDSRLA